MDTQDILFVLALTLVPSAMAWRAYRVGYQHGLQDERRRQERRIRLSRGRNSR